MDVAQRVSAVAAGSSGVSGDWDIVSSRYARYEMTIPSVASSRPATGLRPPSYAASSIAPADPGSRPRSPDAPDMWHALGLGPRRTPSRPSRAAPPSGLSGRDLASTEYPEDAPPRSSVHAGARTASATSGPRPLEPNPVLAEQPLSDPRRMRLLQVDGCLVDDLSAGRLTSLTLAATRVSVRQLEMLSEGIARCPSLALLNLSATNATDAHMDVLSRGLRFNRSIASLDISANLIADRGAEVLARACAQHGTLEHLYLQINKVGPRGMYALCLHAAHMTSLRSLDVSNNPLGDDGVRCLTKMADEAAFDGRQVPLERLYLNTCAFGVAGAESLAALLEAGKLPRLEAVHASDNGIPDGMAMRLRKWAAKAGADVRLATSMADVVDLSWWVDQQSPPPLDPIERALLDGVVDPSLPTRGLASRLEDFPMHDSVVTGRASGAGDTDDPGPLGLGSVAGEGEGVDEGMEVSPEWREGTARGRRKTHMGVVLGDGGGAAGGGRRKTHVGALAGLGGGAGVSFAREV